MNSTGLQPSEQPAGGPLTTEQKATLAECEATIDRGFKAFVEVGRALATIQRQRLYRETDSTFEAYCQRRWSIGRSYGYRLIEAIGVYYDLSPVGDIRELLNERQARELARLEPERRAEAYSAYVAAVQEAGMEPTADGLRGWIDGVLHGFLEDETPPEVSPIGDSAPPVSIGEQAALPEDEDEDEEDDDWSSDWPTTIDIPADPDAPRRPWGRSQGEAAINNLLRIPKDDPEREAGYRAVKRFLDEEGVVTVRDSGGCVSSAIRNAIRNVAYDRTPEELRILVEMGRDALDEVEKEITEDPAQ